MKVHHSSIAAKANCKHLSRWTFAVISRERDRAVICTQKEKEKNPFHHFSIKKTCCLYLELASMSWIPVLLIYQVIEMLLRPPAPSRFSPKRHSALFSLTVSFNERHLQLTLTQLGVSHCNLGSKINLSNEIRPSAQYVTQRGDFISYSLTLHELKLIPFERAASWWPPLQDSILLTGPAQEGGRGWGGVGEGGAYAFHLIWRLDPIKYLSWTTSATAMRFLFLYFLPPSFPAFCLIKFYIKLMGFWLEIMIPPIPHFTSTRMMGGSTFAHWTREFFCWL